MQNILQSRYEVRQVGELTEYLGLSIIRDRARRELYITQNVYTQKILRCFHLENASPISAPTTTTEHLLPNLGTSTHDQQQHYQGMIGSLMYLAVWARPDIAERCYRLGQFAHNPALEHQSSIRNVFAYLSGTSDLGLCFTRDSPPGLKVHSLNFVGYSDASYAEDLHDRKSMSGYLFKLGGGVISWKSRK
ncbi:unnamed protein product [Calypogeia fissa]